MTLEDDGIRVVKYSADVENYSGGQQGNQLQIFRYADVILMLAEAHLRSDDAGAGTGALATLVTSVKRTARLADPLDNLKFS